MKRNLKVLILFALMQILSSVYLFCQQSVKTWDVFEVTLKSSDTPQNPYVNLLSQGKTAHVTAIFTGASGECTGQKITVPGFWDGNDTWKIRFAPTLAGTWNYQTSSADRKMNNKKGQLSENSWSEEEKKQVPTRRGFIVVNNSEVRKGRYFTYSDGTPCLWIADTWF